MELADAPPEFRSLLDRFGEQATRLEEALQKGGPTAKGERTLILAGALLDAHTRGVDEGIGLGRATERKMLRSATEDHVTRGLAGSYVALDLLEPAELLEFFNRMLDVLTGEQET